MLSFLIDAGAQYNGYVSDITRTYAWRSDNLFAHLIKELNDEQLALIDTLRAGQCYTDYHVQMHQRVAKLLKNNKLVNGLSEESIVEQGITCPFLPHGLGHPLGLQVHDVAGFMQDEKGTHLAAPSKYPFLRCTRLLQPGMVLTIEPGLYFIDSLLAPWRNSKFGKHFAWDQIDALKPYGGIRIEDNIVIHEKRTENMTRDLNLT
jgi:Xaa-Pro dipeptidase